MIVRNNQLQWLSWVSRKARIWFLPTIKKIKTDVIL